MASGHAGAYHKRMDWIDFEGEAPFLRFCAVQRDGRLSSHLASVAEIEAAANLLKHQIDVAANRLKLALQKPPPADVFEYNDA